MFKIGKYEPFLMYSGKLPVTVTRKKVKNYNLRISPPDGKITLSVPVYASERSIRAFIDDRTEWLRERHAKYDSAFRTQNIPENFASGDACLVWGREYALDVRYDEKPKNEKIYIDGNKIVFYASLNSDMQKRKKAFEKFLKNEMSEKTAFYMDRYQAEMGVSASSWKLREMKSRWGSCNTRDKKITFNTRLVHKNTECLEYVVVHELCHLTEPNHQAPFKRLMDRYMPDWRIIKKELNE